MSEPASQALRDALALRRAPRGPRPGLEEPLPSGVLQLIRIAAGEEESLASAQAATSETAAAIREAATFYIQQVLFAPASSSFRVLGVDSEEGDERIREHYRWLARWLHPDRNADAWEVVFAERVNQAWQDLRTPDRRERYELQQREDRAELAAQGANAAAAPGRFDLHAYGETAVARRPDLRWLPNAILGSLAICAVAGIALYYAVQLADKRGAAPAVAAAKLTEVFPSRVANGGAPPFDPGQVELDPPDSPVVDTGPIAVTAAPTDVTVSLPTPAQASRAAVTEPTKPVAAAPATPPRPLPVLAATPPEPPVRTAPLARAAPTPSKPGRASAAPAARRDDPPVRAPREAAPNEAAAIAAIAEATPNTKPVVSSRDANRLLNRFSSAYEQGDLASMRSMFTADARGPRGGIDVILADYDRVFESSRERSLAVRDVSWFVSGDTLTIVASFHATVITGRGGRQRKTHGDIRMDLRRQDDQWHIYRLQHDERPG